MSEILRAFLDQNCINKNPAVYTLLNEFVAPVTGAETFGPSSVNLQCKADCYFLVTGWAMTETYTHAAQYGNNSESRDVRFEVENLTTGRIYTFDGPGPRSGINFNLNNFVTMPQYVLFGPRDLIRANMVIAKTAVAQVTRFFNSVILVGIEYRMPSGKG